MRSSDLDMKESSVSERESQPCPGRACVLAERERRRDSKRVNKSQTE